MSRKMFIFSTTHSQSKTEAQMSKNYQFEESMLMITIRWGFSFSRQLFLSFLRKAIYFAFVAITNQAGTQKESIKRRANNILKADNVLRR